MKSLAWMGLAVVLTISLGCKSETPEKVDDAVPETVVPADGADDTTSSNEPGDDADTSNASTTSTGATTNDTTASADVAPGVPPTPASIDADVAVEDDTIVVAEDELAEEPAEPTLQDYMNQMMAAINRNDLDGAIETAQAAITAFPENTDMKFNHLMLRLRAGDALEKAGDEEAAAQHFVETGAIADELQTVLDEVPESLQQVLSIAMVNEARGHAKQGSVDEAIEAMKSAVDSGLAELPDMSDDAFFAGVRDSEEFKTAIAELRELINVRMVEHAREEIAEGQSFPFDFQLTNLDGEAVKLADLKGKVVIVDIWGTWCPPCRMEIPHFVKLQETYANDLAIVGINYENGEGEEMINKIREFAQEQGINYTCVIGDDETRQQVPNFEGFPTTLFIDRTGSVRLKVVGYHPYGKLNAYVQVLMEEPAPATDAS